MEGVSNVSGTLMKANDEVISFKLVAGYLEKFEILNRNLLPIDFQLNSSETCAFMIFLNERVVPSTRIRIDKEVKKIGLDYYNPDELIRFNNGRSVEDDYWIRFRDGDQTYESLLHRLKNLKV